jgi:IS30 family transposase
VRQQIAGRVKQQLDGPQCRVSPQTIHAWIKQGFRDISHAQVRRVENLRDNRPRRCRSERRWSRNSKMPQMPPFLREPQPVSKRHSFAATFTRAIGWIRKRWTITNDGGGTQ